MKRRPEAMLAGRTPAWRSMARATLLGLIVAGAFAGAFTTSPARAGEPPSYLVLRPLGPPAPRTTKWRPSNNVVVARQPYAYGYFGASNGTKWYRSSNYSRSYTQWERR